MNEIWTDVPTMPNYSISTFGNLKRNGTSITTPVNKIGYKRKYLKDHKKNIIIHRVVAEAFIPNPDNLPEVNHKDGDKLNNNVGNLEWVTRQGNATHAKINGLLRQPTGDKAHKAKLKNIHIPIIREAIASGISLTSIAKYFNVSQSAVSLIKTGKNWSTI